MADFEQAVALILKHEGGYVHDKNDPGGETNYGISKRAYPAEDIKALTPERAKALYRRDYWDAIRGPELPFPVALVVFDMAVNAGVSAAVKLLQRSVGATVDGKIGPQTIAKTAAKRAQDVAVGLVGLGVHLWSAQIVNASLRSLIPLIRELVAAVKGGKADG